MSEPSVLYPNQRPRESPVVPASAPTKSRPPINLVFPSWVMNPSASCAASGGMISLLRRLWTPWANVAIGESMLLHLELRVPETELRHAVVECLLIFRGITLRAIEQLEDHVV